MSFSFRSPTFQNFIHFGKDLGQVRKGHRELRRISGEELLGKDIAVHYLKAKVDLSLVFADFLRPYTFKFRPLISEVAHNLRVSDLSPNFRSRVTLEDSP